MTKTVVLFSGGLDSSIMLFRYRQAMESNQLVALSFLYGQRHAREVQHARSISRMLGVTHQVVDIQPSLLLSTSALVHEEEESGTLVDVRGAFIPCRNALFLTVAANRAYMLEQQGRIRLAVGSTASDHLPDQTREFYYHMECALEKGLGNHVTVDHPNIKTKKEQLIQDMFNSPDVHGVRGREVLAITYTCYSGGSIPCGVCHACSDRRKAFKLAGYQDPALPELL